MDVRESTLRVMPHVPEKTATLCTGGTSMREGRKMARMAMRRTAAALALAATVVGIGATGALAQDYPGSTITTGGGTTADEVGDVLTLAPGVTINSGDVSNETGIGVIIVG